MKFQIETVLERDIDLLVLNKFINDASFKDIFSRRVNLEGYEVVECIHSFSDENGESDITVILEKEGHKVGLLIEDKINAIAMPNQSGRYLLRGKKQVKEGVFDEFYVFIIAPKEYLDSNDEAKKYENPITYEELLEHVKVDFYAKTLFEKAIYEKMIGYNVIENKPVTSFWSSFYTLIDDEYPMLKINRNDRPRGINAQWPEFQTPVKGVTIVFKSNKGCCDIQLSNLAKYHVEVYQMVKDKLPNNITLQDAGKSLSFRIKTPVVNFRDDFDKQFNNLAVCLEAVKELQELVHIIDFKKILDLRNK